MLQRTVKSGQYAGSRFWGCSNYPQCHGIRNVAGPA
jgi:ssDNA-binding Zn-finger/Zn-ribbon topoisomerase 1